MPVQLEHPPDSSLGRNRRVQQIVDEWLRRRDRGESMDILGDLAANPDLRDELLNAIRKLAVILRAQLGSGTPPNAEPPGPPPDDAHAPPLGDAAPGRPQPPEDDSPPAAAVTESSPPSAEEHSPNTAPTPATNRELSPSILDLRQFAAGAAEVPNWPLADEPALPPPGTFRGYEIVREIGRGGQGIVYYALDLAANSRPVAIKVLKGVPSARELRHFKQEIELVLAARHPNIVTVHHVAETRDRLPFFVMEFIHGSQLTRHVRERRLSLEDVLRLFIPVCDAVQFAHQRGIMHRDLKPSNVLIDGEGTPKVLDFGLARWLGAADTAASVEGLIGTVPYMSPEQARGKNHYLDTRTDIYSLGVILYEALTGRFPYDVRGDIESVLRNIRETDPASPRKQWSPDVGVPHRISRRTSRRQRCPIDEGVEAILFTALAKERPRRYQHVSELAEDLAAYLAGRPLPHARVPSVWYRTRRFARRNRFRLGAAAMVGLLATSALWGAQEAQARAKADQDARTADAATLVQRDRRLIRGTLGGDHPPAELSDEVKAAFDRAWDRIASNQATDSERDELAAATLRVNSFQRRYETIDVWQRPIGKLEYDVRLRCGYIPKKFAIRVAGELRSRANPLGRWEGDLKFIGPSWLNASVLFDDRGDEDYVMRVHAIVYFERQDGGSTVPAAAPSGCAAPDYQTTGLNCPPANVLFGPFPHVILPTDQPEFPVRIANAAYARRFAEALEVRRFGFVWETPCNAPNRNSKRNILRVRFVVPPPSSPLACELIIGGRSLGREYHCPFVVVPDPETRSPKLDMRFSNRDVAVTGDGEAWTFTVDFDALSLMFFGDPQRLIGEPVLLRIASSRDVARDSHVEDFVDVGAERELRVLDLRPANEQQAATEIFPLLHELAVPSRVQDELARRDLPDSVRTAALDMLALFDMRVLKDLAAFVLYRSDASAEEYERAYLRIQEAQRIAPPGWWSDERQIVLGMALYRTSHFTGAIEALARLGSVSAQSRTTSLAVTAMAHEGAGQRGEAREAIEALRDHLKQHPGLGGQHRKIADEALKKCSELGASNDQAP